MFPPVLSLCIVTYDIVVEMAGFMFKVDDGGDEEETNMRNGGDRGKSKSMLYLIPLLDQVERHTNTKQN